MIRYQNKELRKLLMRCNKLAVREFSFRTVCGLGIERATKREAKTFKAIDYFPMMMQNSQQANDGGNARMQRSCSE